MASGIVQTHPTSPDSGRDQDSLVCAGCAEPVHCAPSTRIGVQPVPGAEFSHRDGSELCPDSVGAPAQPVEYRHPAAGGGVRAAVTEVRG